MAISTKQNQSIYLITEIVCNRLPLLAVPTCIMTLKKARTRLVLPLDIQSFYGKPLKIIYFRFGDHTNTPYIVYHKVIFRYDG